jgi:hypothetical protein
MTEELVSRLHRLQRIAGAMRGLMREAQAAAPAGAAAEDTTGAVTVVLDAQGSPFKITVAVDWRRRLGTRTLGAAVMDANGKAVLARMKAWTQALQDGVWARKVERMMATGPDDSGVADIEVPELFRRKAVPRPLGDLSDEMVRALDSTEPQATEASRFHGANRGRTVAITLDANGMTGCLVNHAWAARQSGVTMSAALGEALASAKVAARAAVERSSAARTLDTLLNETVSLLQDPERLGRE